MSGWLSFAVALLSALAAGAGTCLLASLAMQWYRVSSFEGKSGFAVVGLTLLGLIAGLVLGLVASRVGAARGITHFGANLGIAIAVILVLLAIAAAVTRGLADVPPTLDGHTLDLAVELRFPAAQQSRPDFAKDKVRLEIGALAGRTVRTRRDGRLDLAKARQVDGRWVIPGTVPVFTSRGARILLFTLGERSQGFLVPLPGRPRGADREFGEWLPRNPTPGVSENEALTYRYRVVDADE